MPGAPTLNVPSRGVQRQPEGRRDVVDPGELLRGVEVRQPDVRGAAEQQRRAGTEDGGGAQHHHARLPGQLGEHPLDAQLGLGVGEAGGAQRVVLPQGHAVVGVGAVDGAGAGVHDRGDTRPSAASKAVREPSTFTLSASRGSSTRNARCTSASAPSRSRASAGSRVSRTTSRTPFAGGPSPGRTSMATTSSTRASLASSSTTAFPMRPRAPVTATLTARSRGLA